MPGRINQIKKDVWKLLFLVFVLSVLLPGSMVHADEVSLESSTGLKKVEEDRQKYHSDVKTQEAVKKTNAGTEKTKAEKPGKWKSRNQKFFYYINGKKISGMQEIQGKYYYFASNGIQRTGWQQHGGNYYFFRIANGSKGCMEASNTVNGIKLAKDGKAVLTAASTAKLKVLCKANKIVEKLVKPGMKKSEKLKKCYEYVLEHFQYRGSPVFEESSHWELDYALDLFDEGHGSCYAFGAAFAFLANAVGYKECYAVSSGGHGWAEAGGKVYDPTWGLVDKKHSYYGVSFRLSGVDGRPNYRNSRKYVVEI